MENEKIKPGDKLISTYIYNSDQSQVLKKNWNLNLDFETENVILTTEPFKTCRIRKFLQKPLGTYDLCGELRSVHNRKRGNDLMKLEESVCDLQEITSKQTYSQNIECIKLLCSELISDFRSWLSEITGIELDNKLSIRTSTYTDTDFLLCHNDQVEDRQIAFILYLNKEWKEEYGGQLNLFKSNNGVPTEIDKSLSPEYNSLLFFQVTNESFHSVSEILKNTTRFSVNGWFHGTVKSSEPTLLPKKLEETPSILHATKLDFNISTFIHDSRLSNSTFIKIINKVLETTSFCGIKNYVKEDQFRSLLKEISSTKIRWIEVVPPDRRKYEIADVATLPEKLKKFYDMFQSTDFCELLTSYTELQLAPNETKNAKLTIELQRWHQGCYTVLHDGYVKNKEQEEGAVDFEDSEDEELQELQRLEQNKKTNGRRSASSVYDVKDMLQDIIVDSNDLSKILPSLPTSIVKELEDNSGESGPSSSSHDNGPTSPKRSRLDGEETSEVEDNESEASEIKGTLDVVMYFHGENAPENTTLNYVDPGREDGVFLTLPIKDNSLFIVYRQDGVVRHNEYVNHYCNGNFYSLVCSYTE